MNRFRRAFSMVELLVVMAIISVLIAILVPSLLAARTETKRIQCRNKLKGIAEAWVVAEQDSAIEKGANMHFKYGGSVGTFYAGPRPLNAFLGLPPIEEREALEFQCPSDPNKRQFKDFGTSYFANYMIFNTSVNAPPLAGEPCSDVFDTVNNLASSLDFVDVTPPAKVPVVGDGKWQTQINGWYNNTADSWHKKDGYFNIAFADGHAEFVRLRTRVFSCDEYNWVPRQELQAELQTCQASPTG